jgi:histidyl-tRNA synthetase
MRDIQPSEHKEIEFIREKFILIVKKFNFQLMDPSPIEMLSTLSAKGGPAIIADTYNFVDKGGRHIALRFDYTVGLSRYVSTRRDLKFPAKLASFGGVGDMMNLRWDDTDIFTNGT